MMSVPGFRTHIENYFGFAPFGLTLDTFLGYILNKDMACLKVPFLIQVIEALEGGQHEFLVGCYNTVVLAIYANINVYVRIRRDTELSAVVGYEPPKILPLTQIADAFVRAFRPILEGRIEESFESYIDDHEYSLKDIEAERELLKMMRMDPLSTLTYRQWRERLVESECENIGKEESDPSRDRNYMLLAGVCQDDDNYLHLTELIDRRKNTFNDISNDLREFRKMVMNMAKMDMQPSAQRTKSTPQMLRALSRKSSVNLMARQGGAGADLVQKSIVVSYLHF
jgi:hypothetical protein